LKNDSKIPKVVYQPLLLSIFHDTFFDILIKVINFTISITVGLLKKLKGGH